MTLPVPTYEFAPSDWRAAAAETLIVDQRIDTAVNSDADGNLTSTVETLTDWCSEPAAASTGYLYADGNYYKDAVTKFQAHTRTTVTYRQAGAASYSKTTTVVDLLTGKTTSQTSEIVDGTIPKAPRKNSAFTRIPLQPVAMQIVDTCVGDHFADSTDTLDLSGAEDADQAAAMLAWRMKLATAIDRSVDRRFIPFSVLDETKTVRLIDPSRGVDKRGILWTITGTGDLSKGKVDATYLMKFFTR